MNWLMYIDPGSGSYLVQALVAAAVGVGFFFRSIAAWVRHWFYRLFKSKKETP
jgi:ATP-dependent Zn protease